MIVSKGHARQVTLEEAEATSLSTWYLPHHAVLNPNKPRKVHIVFDATAKFESVSLNDKPLTGPDIGILMRFQSGNIGFMVHIEQMFHQVYVCEEDRDSSQFLWRNLDDTQRGQSRSLDNVVHPLMTMVK